MDIELFYTPNTRAFRPRWLLEELEIPYILRPVGLMRGQRNPAHPRGAVPAARVDGMTVIESGAVCHWLTDRCPDRQLAPAPDDPQRARYEQWMFFTPGTLEPPGFDILLHSMILPKAQRVAVMAKFTGQHVHHVPIALVSESLQNKRSTFNTAIAGPTRELPYQPTDNDETGSPCAFRLQLRQACMSRDNKLC
jgi:glutathione S-transferase